MGGIFSRAILVRKENRPAKKWNCKSVRAAPSAQPTVPLVKSQYFRVVLT